MFYAHSFFFFFLGSVFTSLFSVFLVSFWLLYIYIFFLWPLAWSHVNNNNYEDDDNENPSQKSKSKNRLPCIILCFNVYAMMCSILWNIIFIWCGKSKRQQNLNAEVKKTNSRTTNLPFHLDVKAWLE